MTTAASPSTLTHEDHVAAQRARKVIRLAGLLAAEAGLEVRPEDARGWAVVADVIETNDVAWADLARSYGRPCSVTTRGLLVDHLRQAAARLLAQPTIDELAAELEALA